MLADFSTYAQILDAYGRRVSLIHVIHQIAGKRQI